MPTGFHKNPIGKVSPRRYLTVISQVFSQLPLIAGLEDIF